MTAPHHDIANTPEPLRVGFICVNPLEDARFQSGMPHQMANAFRRNNLEIEELCVWSSQAPRGSFLKRIRNRARFGLKRRAPYAWQRAIAWQGTIDSLAPALAHKRLLRRAHLKSAKIQAQIESRAPSAPELDAFFLCCDHNLLAEVRTSLPVFFYSDATSYILRDTYVWHPSPSHAFYDAMHCIERATLSTTDACIYASEVSRHSAVELVGIPPERTHVVPMGANVTPDDPGSVTAPTPAPTRDDCQLLIIAADPVRKRVDLALHATEILRERAINATLNVIGPGTEACKNNPAANLIGWLKLSDAQDQAKHQDLLRICHIQLLPSLGEAYGIAPIESAHFARPSIVSNVGGLPFVVQHDRTGLVIEVDASATAWADAIESLINNPGHYQAMSSVALQRARAELNWDAWGRSVVRIIRDTIDAHR